MIIENEENYVASEERDTTGHGTKIVNHLETFSPDATYKTYRVIAGDEKFKPSNFLKAMDDISQDNVDVVNISAGKFHSDCGTECRICMATNDVVSSGSVVVAGAGNRQEENSLGVFCPAKSPNAIGVGASETLCTASPSNNGTKMIQGPSSRPPGAYWLEREEDYPFYPDQNYCGYSRCSPFHECENNRKIVYWDGNVSWDAYLPEVVAPGHTFLQDEQTGFITLEPGTSYACAVVSGGIATVLSDILPRSPSPHQIRRAVEATSINLDCGPVGKFGMSELRKVLE